MKSWKEIAGDFYLIGLALWMSLVFVHINMTGSYMIAVEPRSWIAWFELVAMVLLVVLGIDRLIDDLRR